MIPADARQKAEVKQQMKKVLLIAGGGAIGTYVGKELIAQGHEVDVICLEDKSSDNERLHFIKGNATVDFLTEFLADKYYDAIVNFLHFPDAGKYKPYDELLTARTDQLVVLSSYRVYADLQHPVTESAPLLADVSDDAEFLKNETYAMGKTRCERYIHDNPGKNNRTIVRPVISFAGSRFDIVMHNEHVVFDAVKNGTSVLLPEGSRELAAGLDWAGNTGKIIAHLLFKKETLGETYTISSGQNHTWGEIADWYTEFIGVEFKWIDTEEYTRIERDRYRLIYDRLFNRDIDAGKVLKAAGLTKDDFTPIKTALKLEIDKFLRGE